MIELKFQKTLHSTNKGKLDLEVDCKLNLKEFVALFGKSGSGKTTILRILSGLSSPDCGLIKFNNQVWFDSSKKINLSPQKRKIGFVFQDYALFPHMSVEQNLLFALPKGEDKKRVYELLELAELSNLRDKKPNFLSGGQQQRVALMRALVQNPQLLLLDEPLSALDLSMRQKLQKELLKIHHHFNLSTILVSHSFSEVFALANYVLHLKNGKIDRQGSPQEVFLNQLPSGKFRQSGEILNISENGIMRILSVLVGNEIIKVTLSCKEAQSLSVGDLVVVSSKAWNPIVTQFHFEDF